MFKNSRLFMNVSSIGSFSEWLRQDVPYKAEI